MPATATQRASWRVTAYTCSALSSV